MPRILTKSSQDETLSTPKRMLSQSYIKKGRDSSSLSRKRGRKTIPTSYSLKNLVVEVDGYVINDDQGIFAREITKKELNIAELIMKLKSLVETLEDVSHRPEEYGISAEKMKWQREASPFRVTVRDRSPEDSTSRIKKRISSTASPYLAIIRDSDSESSQHEASEKSTYTSTTRGLFSTPREVKAPIQSHSDDSQGSFKYSPVQQITKSPSLFERIRSRLSFGF